MFPYMTSVLFKKGELLCTSIFQSKIPFELKSKHDQRCVFNNLGFGQNSI